MKLFLTEKQSPGDILMMTAAVRDLKRSHPEYQINCKTSAQELWENNPYLDLSVTEQNADRVIQCHYPLIHTSTQGCHHFIHGFRRFLEEQLGVSITPGNFCVDVHLSEKEKHDPYIMDIVGDKPFWIIDAGGKRDFTCKWWEFDRFQQVVDETAGEVRWVQIGAAEHQHKPLRGVINMLGKTTHRQFLSLMYRASGVLTPVSYPMHLATMQWFNHSDDEHRPCVVIAGSREPAVWEAYTCHRYLHNCGMLDCSRRGACWRSRVEPLPDGSRQNASICVHPVMTSSGQRIPYCLDLITVQDVVDSVRMYLYNGERTRPSNFILRQ